MVSKPQNSLCMMTVWDPAMYTLIAAILMKKLLNFVKWRLDCTFTVNKPPAFGLHLINTNYDERLLADLHL